MAVLLVNDHLSMDFGHKQTYSLDRPIQQRHALRQLNSTPGNPFGPLDQFGVKGQK